VLLYAATKFAKYYIQVKTLYIHKCSIPKAPLSIQSCIALASYKDTKVVWSESGYEPVLLWNCTVSSRLAAFTLADILVYQLIVTHVYLHCLFHYKIYIPVFVAYQPRNVLLASTETLPGIHFHCGYLSLCSCICFFWICLFMFSTCSVGKSL